MKTISISLYNRARYTQQVLNHLDQCFDIENYKVLIFCEPGDNEVISIAKHFRPSQTTVTVNTKKLGCSKNIYQCWEAGFNYSDFHIHLEDDTVPAKDFLIYCEYLKNIYIDNTSIFSISGYVNSNNKIMNEQFTQFSDQYNVYSKRNWFTPWGWATWITRWPLIKEAFIRSLESKISWDHFVHKALDDKFEIFPVVARIQNIGAEKGTYCPSPRWHQNNQYNEYWIETDKKYQTSFIEK
jgi:hypothetical protein